MARLAAPFLAGVSVALALMCVGLAVAWKHQHDVVVCFQEAADQDRVPQDRECGG